MRPFICADYINTQSNKTDFIQNNDEIILTRKIVINRHGDTNKYSLPHKSLMTMTENNHLIVKAFTYAFKYRKMYEETGNTDTILESENITWRTLYKYLTLAYLSPRVVNALMSGKLKIPLRDLYDKATKHQEFEDQERLFFNS